MSSINVLKSSISSRKGLAKENRFEFVFTRPDVKSSEEISVLCETAQLPGRQIFSNEYSTIKKSEKIPYTYSVDDITVTLHLTNDYYLKKVMDNWFDSVINPNKYQMNYHADFTSDIQIYQLNLENRRIYGINLKNAYPTVMNSLTLDNNSSSPQKLSVTFTYEDYEIIDLYDFTKIDKVVKFIKNLFD